MTSTLELPIALGVADEVSLPCQRADADLWFSDVPAELEVARVLCTECPIRVDCLTGAVGRAEPWGVWGGEIFERGAVVGRKRSRGRPRNADVANDPARHAAAAARAAAATRLVA